MSLVRCPDPATAAAWCTATRDSGARLGFVPTMGALHEGHLTLVRRALAENERACVSVFVNPLQFDDPKDCERYPRDLEADARLLESAGCSMLFTGTLEQFFPARAPGAPVPRREPGPAAQGLEGEFRPGHFAGVVTICARLFERSSKLLGFSIASDKAREPARGCRLQARARGSNAGYFINFHQLS